MRPRHLSFAVLLFSLLCAHSPAAVLYVDAGSSSPASPFSAWTTAATNIQDAIDAAGAGDQILVTNGLYQTGGRVVFGAMTNRVAVTKPLTVQSVNGPGFTVIQGNPVLGNTAVRCVYLTNGATLVGFTLAKGATRNTGDLLREGSGGGLWCESTNSQVVNCILTGNSAYQYGAGAYLGSLDNCAISTNLATGGIAWGGGVYGSALTNCTLSGNSSRLGGGAYGASLNNCQLIGNSAYISGGGGGGGGADACKLNNCLLMGNAAASAGGGAASSNFGDTVLNNCTVTGNTGGGGVNNCVVNNCIVWANVGGDISLGLTTYSCSSPLVSGTGNISNDPQFLADGAHVSVGSPCRGKGSSAFATGKDIDGQTWAATPSMGFDEWHPEPVLITKPGPKPVAGWGRAALLAGIAGQEPFTCWWSKDGTVLEDNAHYNLAHTANVTVNGFGLADAGNYQVLVSNAFGTATSQVSHLTIHCVTAAASAPAAPYTNWATAAATIQDAVEAAGNDDWILATNGIYSTGGKAIGMTNRVALDKPVVLASINGPETTFIEGHWHPGTTNGVSSVRCAWLTNGATLLGFTLRKGATTGNSFIYGSGVWCASSNAIVSSCIILGNAAASSYGGASYSGALNNCVLTANFGGGAASGLLNNCTITGNSGAGGGAIQCALNNCITWSNLPANYSSSTLAWCCATPLPPGPGNFTNDPIFANLAGPSLLLDPRSPCINAGNNAGLASSADLGGQSRVAGGTVDVGAYEFQTPSSVLSYVWLQQYGFPADGSADYSDPDGDGMNNWQEWRCGTDPTNGASVLRLLDVTKNGSSLTARWRSVTNRTYFLERSANLGAQPPFLVLKSNLIGQAVTTSYADTSATGPGPFFYRVGVP